MKYLRKKLSSNQLMERVTFTFLLFLVLFYGIIVLSYFFLPEGFLKNKSPLQNWVNSDSTVILSIQIFAFNMLSVLIIFLTSLFGKKKVQETNYLSIGYSAFFVFISINGLVLGTWSFSVQSEAIPLINRIVCTFDLIHKAGLWEMMGQLLITCSLAHIAMVLMNGKNTTTKKIRQISLSKAEALILATGIMFMIIGAIVESIAIHSF